MGEQRNQDAALSPHHGPSPDGEAESAEHLRGDVVERSPVSQIQQVQGGEENGDEDDSEDWCHAGEEGRFQEKKTEEQLLYYRADQG